MENQKGAAMPAFVTMCTHYKRNCIFIAECCEELLSCKKCHDTFMNHKFKGFVPDVLICTYCGKRQNVKENCEYCGIYFGKYSCFKCLIFDDQEVDRFHCDLCKRCIQAKTERVFHCKVCNICLPIEVENNHTCVKDVGSSNCLICLEPTWSEKCFIPKCGHLIHKMCFDRLTNNGLFACPTCEKSLFDMSHIWKLLDSEIKATPVDQEHILGLCRECDTVDWVLNHPVGVKCRECGAYNTISLEETIKGSEELMDISVEESLV